MVRRTRTLYISIVTTPFQLLLYVMPQVKHQKTQLDIYVHMCNVVRMLATVCIPAVYCLNVLRSSNTFYYGMVHYMSADYVPHGIYKHVYLI